MSLGHIGIQSSVCVFRRQSISVALHGVGVVYVWYVSKWHPLQPEMITKHTPSLRHARCTKKNM